jgi:hypothetical protein
MNRWTSGVFHSDTSNSTCISASTGSLHNGIDDPILDVTFVFKLSHKTRSQNHFTNSQGKILDDHDDVYHVPRSFC